MTVTSTVSVEPSGWVTSTGTVISSPGSASSETGTVTSPVFSSTVTPSGAPSPGVNLVSSGTSVSLPSLSLMVGAGTVTSSPGLPEPSPYSGSKDSLSFAAGAGASRINFAGTSRDTGSAPSAGVHVTFTSTLFSPSTCLSAGHLTAPVLGSILSPSFSAAAGSANSKVAPADFSSTTSVFGLSKEGFASRSFSLAVPLVSS